MSAATPDTNSIDVEATLREAAARNTPVELHRRTATGGDPVARGRLLHVDDERLYLEEPQVIGFEQSLRRGEELDGYFALGSELRAFRTNVLALNQRIRLNEDKVVMGVTMRRPTSLKIGQRRDYFRTSLALLDPISVELHLAGDTAPDACPIDGGPYKGQLVDASGGGFGVIVDGAPALRFPIFTKVFLRFEIADPSLEICTLAEIRQVRSIHHDQVLKLGVLAKPWPDQRAHQRAMQQLTRFLTAVQRMRRRGAA